MDRDRFYDLVESARSGSLPGDASADPEVLAERLRPLADEELAAFVVRFDAELTRLGRWDVWAAGYAADGGMSDDGFHYFRAWIVGKGRVAVETAVTDPDGLAEFLDDVLENEELGYVAVELLEERGLDPYDGVELHADDEPVGEPFDEDDLDSRFPRITAASA